MVHFFGILSPGFATRVEADEAPHKTGFFGGEPAIGLEVLPLSRIELAACYLDGKAPEPELVPDAVERPFPFTAMHLF